MTYKTDTKYQIDTKPISSKHDDDVPKRSFSKIKERQNKEKKEKSEHKNIFEVAAEFYTNRQSVDGLVKSVYAPLQTALSSEVLGLIDKFIQVIEHETNKGISITTVDIHTKDENSLLNGTLVVFEHYDTAPDSFNLEFKGTAEAITHLQNNFPLLETSLKEHFPQHRFQFRSSLSQKKRRKKISSQIELNHIL